MQLETKEPAHAAMASLGNTGKRFMGMNSPVMTDPKGGGIHKGNTAATAHLLGLQIDGQGKKNRLHQFGKAIIGNRSGEFCFQILSDIKEVEMFYALKITEMEKHHNGHHLTRGHGKSAVSLLFRSTELTFCHFFRKFLVEIINGYEDFGDEV